MSCNDFTVNYRPVGVGYDSNSKPRSFAELSAITVDSVSASDLYVDDVYAKTSYPILFHGSISATSYLGAGGGGVSNFVDLGDVDSGLTLASRPGQLVIVNPATNKLSASAPSDVFTGNYQPSDSVLTEISDLAVAADTYIYFTPAATLGTIKSYGRSLVSASSASVARNTLGLSALATVNSVGLIDLNDTQGYDNTVANYVLSVNSSGNAVVWLDPSTFASSGLSALVTSIEASTINLSSYAGGLSAYIAANEGTWNSGGGGGISNFSDAGDVNLTTPSNNDLLKWDSGTLKWINFTPSYATTSQLADYVTTATNSTLSSLVSNIQTSTVNLSSYISSQENGWSNLALAGLTTDVTISRQSTNDLLIYNGTEWTNSAVPFVVNSQLSNYVLTSVNTNLSSTVTSLQTSTINLSAYAGNLSAYISANEAGWSIDSLQYYLSALVGDVAISSPVSGDVLSYSGTKWVNNPKTYTLHEAYGNPLSSTAGVLTTPKSYYSVNIPAYTVSAGNIIEMTVIGLLSNTNTTQGIQLQSKFGATTCTNSQTSITTSANKYFMWFKVRIIALSGGSQMLFIEYRLGDAGGTTHGYGNWGSVAKDGISFNPSITEDATSAKTLDLLFYPNTTATGVQIDIYHVKVEVLR